MPIWVQADNKKLSATESTEEHEKIACNAFIFPCFSVFFRGHLYKWFLEPYQVLL